MLTYTHVLAIGNLAHAGGALLGALLGFTIAGTHRMLSATSLALTIALLAAGVTIARPYIAHSTKSASTISGMAYTHPPVLVRLESKAGQ